MRATARRMLRAARGQAGYTLVELLVTLAILGIVLAALIAAWAAGLRAEGEAARRQRAQQDARVAVDRMRDELHCADSLTLTSASSITVRLPAACPEANGTSTSVTYSASCNGLRCTLRRGTLLLADFVTTASVFSYTPPSATSLGKLRVTLPVDPTPTDAVGAWRLAVDIALRNTVRA